MHKEAFIFLKYSTVYHTKSNSDQNYKNISDFILVLVGMHFGDMATKLEWPELPAI
jgi:hypothetical protein